MDREATEEYAEIFAALADETRLEVLLAIMERAAREGPLTYSEAMAAADLDDSGHFNYHLGELTENFLYRIGDRYTATTAAWELYKTVGTGRVRDNDLDRLSARLDVACMGCGESLHAVYDYEFFVLCPACGRTPFMVAAGPDVAADADLRSLARELDEVDRRHTRLLLEGRCQDCGGRAAAWSETSSEFMFTPTAYYVNVTCGNCGNGFRRRTPGQYVLADPAVTEYADEHGIDLYERPQWAYEWARSDYWTVVRSEEPLLLEQHAIVDGCRLVAEIAVDEDHSTGVDGLRFVEVTRVDHVPLDGVPDDAPGGAVRGDRAASASDRPTLDRSAVDE